MAQGKDKPAAATPPAAQATPAAADAAKQDIWFKVCFAVPTPDPVKPGEQPKQQKPEDMKKTQICLTQVEIRDTQLAILRGDLAIRQVEGQDKMQVLVMLPLGSQLKQGAAVQIDQEKAIPLQYTICDHAGCYAEADIDKATLDKMKAGKTIAYAGIVMGQQLTIPIPLTSFGKAFDGAPLPVEKYNENLKKLAEFTQTRLAELRQKAQEEAAKAQGAGAAKPADKPADKKK
jgi:invasion protein IalB